MTKKAHRKSERLMANENEKDKKWEGGYEGYKQYKRVRHLKRTIDLSIASSCIVGILFVVVLMLPSLFPTSNSPESEYPTPTGEFPYQGGTGSNTPQFSFNYTATDGVTAPTGQASVIGSVTQISDSSGLVVQTMSMNPGQQPTTGTEENVVIDQSTDIFTMSRESGSSDTVLTKASFSDIQTGSFVMIWGQKNLNGDWVATDIGISEGMGSRYG